jgi:hypothetical protein
VAERKNDGLAPPEDFDRDAVGMRQRAGLVQHDPHFVHLRVPSKISATRSASDSARK